MIIYGVYSVLTAESEEKLAEFFQGSPVEVKLPLLYELGTSKDPGVLQKLDHPSVIYELVPLAMNVRFNPRTGNSALFWDLESLSPNAAVRQHTLGTVLVEEDKEEWQSAYNSIFLSHDIHAYRRNAKAWFNSKGDTLASLINLGEPLILAFEGETVIELDVPSTSVVRA